jgi:glucose dehydrogenase
VSILYGGAAFGLGSLDLRTGSEIWANDNPHGSIVGQIAMGNGLIYAKIGDETIAAFDQATGEARWKQVTSGRVEPPVVDGDTLFVAGYKGVIAMDAHTGTFQWRKSGQYGDSPTTTVEDLSTARPAIGDGVIFVPQGNGVLAALDEATGDVRWVRSAVHGITTPVVVGGMPIAIFEGNVQAHDPATGDTLWTLPQEGDVRGFAIGDGHIVEASEMSTRLAGFVLQ